MPRFTATAKIPQPPNCAGFRGSTWLLFGEWNASASQELPRKTMIRHHPSCPQPSLSQLGEDFTDWTQENIDDLFEYFINPESTRVPFTDGLDQRDQKLAQDLLSFFDADCGEADDKDWDSRLDLLQRPALCADHSSVDYDAHNPPSPSPPQRHPARLPSSPSTSRVRGPQLSLTIRSKPNHRSRAVSARIQKTRKASHSASPKMSSPRKSAPRTPLDHDFAFQQYGFPPYDYMPIPSPGFDRAPLGVDRDDLGPGGLQRPLERPLYLTPPHTNPLPPSAWDTPRSDEDNWMMGGSNPAVTCGAAAENVGLGITASFPPMFSPSPTHPRSSPRVLRTASCDVLRTASCVAASLGAMPPPGVPEMQPAFYRAHPRDRSIAVPIAQAESPPLPRTPHRRTKSGCYTRRKSMGAVEFSQVGFVNFTPEDKRKILNGVAPSGSSKTKARREKEAAEKQRKLSEAARKAVIEAGGDVSLLERKLAAG
ncbi:hypothetical protein EJ06DRAFT_304225 [Trichodelitschia bisporula]|uniref:Developmental regulatory protein wetA n=1 Tax=Trichodelitschia bisporula TaxID=703511 RepID=A0A6G1I798_9PEZI|nr:hypothetical protein EJ06DRAFT_304225 [Trichodelitschia bisporula]